ncbi:putative phage abortive infection protein [Aliarcobacter butzleri]|uniref:putative phage abortive infection protein n=1 Tax=Aliarcobacter butzleri TaxID=28197 RepID=UPI0021B5C4AF|nr:putative phage abortive infection protein [Aliarcobacter butzleri]MCT7650951.1 putative phage abortive infection protein [Aliarcobacter butzleri]
MEEKRENLDNTDQCKSIYTSLWQFIKEWWIYGLIVILAALLIYKVQDFYFSKHSLTWVSEEIEELGQMGDFFGGTLNPILAFFSFCLLLITIKIQNKELKNSTDELAKSSQALTEQSKSLIKQNFETTFFNMINLHNEIVNNSSLSMFKNYFELKQEAVPVFRHSHIIPEERKIYFYKIDNSKVNIVEDKEYNGRKSFYKLFEILNQFIKDHINSNNNNPTGLYNAFHSEYSQIINHYFRNLYHILRIVDEEDDFDIDKKKYYTSILRAQISNYELALIFMNAIYKEGDSKLFPLLVKFEFMEPLNLVIAQPHNNNVTFYKYLIDETYLKYVIRDYLEKISKINYEDKIFGSNNHMKEYINYINTSSQEQQ